MVGIPKRNANHLFLEAENPATKGGRQTTDLPLRSITDFLKTSKSSYEYHRTRLGRGSWGYRTIWARLRRHGVSCSEKRVRRVMREEGLHVSYHRRRRRGHGSYAGEIQKARRTWSGAGFAPRRPTSRDSRASRSSGCPTARRPT